MSGGQPQSNAELQVSLDMAQQEHDEVCVLLQAYISGCARPTTPPIRSLKYSQVKQVHGNVLLSLLHLKALAQLQVKFQMFGARS